MRNTGGITESELTIPALRAMSNQPGGFISTTDLIAELTDAFRPTGKDAETIEGRKDTHFSQKVRNIVSHKNQPGNMIHDEYAEHVDDGLQITEKGRAHLNQQGR